MEPDFLCADIFNVFSGGYPCGKPDVTHTQSQRYFFAQKLEDGDWNERKHRKHMAARCDMEA